MRGAGRFRRVTANTRDLSEQFAENDEGQPGTARCEDRGLGRHGGQGMLELGFGAGRMRRWVGWSGRSAAGETRPGPSRPGTADNGPCRVGRVCCRGQTPRAAPPEAGRLYFEPSIATPTGPARCLPRTPATIHRPAGPRRGATAQTPSRTTWPWLWSPRCGGPLRPRTTGHCGERGQRTRRTCHRRLGSCLRATHRHTSTPSFSGYH